MITSLFDQSQCTTIGHIHTEQNYRKKIIYSCSRMPGIKGRVKAFDINLSNKFDTIAREFIKNKLTDNVIDNPDKYGEDMIVMNTIIPFKYIELQVYGKWIDNFPYVNPFVYERKMRFCGETLFICFNYHMTRVIMFSKSSIQLKKCRAEKYSREYIHYVPWNRVFQINADILSLNTIKECFCFDE